MSGPCWEPTCTCCTYWDDLDNERCVEIMSLQDILGRGVPQALVPEGLAPALAALMAVHGPTEVAKQAYIMSTQLEALGDDVVAIDETATHHGRDDEPLTVYNALSLLRHCARVDPALLNAVEIVEAEIDRLRGLICDTVVRDARDAAAETAYPTPRFDAQAARDEMETS